MKRIIYILLLALAPSLHVYCQELQAKVTINHNQIQGTDVSVFDNLQQTLEQFINDRQWTNLQFQKNERIVCNFNITVTKYDASSNTFTCSAMIQANRPVYNSAYTYDNKQMVTITNGELGTYQFVVTRLSTNPTTVNYSIGISTQ
jgi:hypothetical protein